MKPAVRDIRSGFIGFTIAWIGQAASLLGSAMTWFALSIWTYELTGQATALALLSFFSFGPTLLLSPVAGVLVDRWNRKTVLILSDLMTGSVTIVVLILYLAGNLQIWHLYLVGFSVRSVPGLSVSGLYSGRDDDGAQGAICAYQWHGRNWPVLLRACWLLCWPVFSWDSLALPGS